MTFDEDMTMLRELVAKVDELDAMDDAGPLEFVFQGNARRAFREMLERGQALTDKQRTWAKSVYERVFGVPQYENLVSSGRAPRGKEVRLLVDDMPKPKKPPPRRP
jgi:hypothetical protein